MIRIKVEYDAYNRNFKLIDREFGRMLDDGAVYELSVPLVLHALEDDGDILYIDRSSVV